MRVFAVPRSIARSFENKPFSQSKSTCALPYHTSGESLLTQPNEAFDQPSSCARKSPLRTKLDLSCGARCAEGNAVEAQKRIAFEGHAVPYTNQPLEILPSLCG